MVDGKKRCAVCGRVFDLVAFRALPLRGVESYGDDGDASRFEFRDCRCGNTVAIEIDRDGNPVTDPRPF
jgi:hypothetical protein